MIDADWIKLDEDFPDVDGWYLVRYENSKSFAMYYKVFKKHYSDSQWFVNSDTGHSWQGKLPDEWLRIAE